ncbi:MAG: XTP/dITP diphosphatase [Chloroflexi bacterium]|nr:XTP/dITP diphosphatase [Chloroflexota bacterium]
MHPKLLVATNNKGKLREYKSLLRDLPYELLTLEDVGIDGAIPETGESMEENARLKATTYAKQSHLLTLADDSGLEVDVLNGEPGVRSARYAGEDASDADRVAYLLTRLKDVPWEKRSARFVCVIAIATPSGEVRLSFGECRGFITFEPRGKNGFGYDPVFSIHEQNKTMAELLDRVKNQISHRARAAMKARVVLNEIVGVL